MSTDFKLSKVVQALGFFFWGVQSHSFYFFGPRTISLKTKIDIVNVFFNASEKIYLEETI